jgi:hypothetical protein
MANKDYLWFGIIFSQKAKKNPFRSSGNMTTNAKITILDTIIRNQEGKGPDKSKRNERDVYHIKIKWYPENDRVETDSDTGNDSLTAGILATYLEKIDKPLKKGA